MSEVFDLLSANKAQAILRYFTAHLDEVNVKDTEGNAPLHLLAWEGNVKSQ